MLTPSPGPGHPRVCGEQVRSVTRPWLGSRAIPACAGNSDRNRPTCSGKHGPSPRVRGTVMSRLWLLGTVTGHPRVCGEQRRGRSATPHAGRAIPACAGNRLTTQPTRRSWAGPSPRVRGTGCQTPRRMPLAPGHPRVCGEQYLPGTGANPAWRAIPACAGNSLRIRTVGTTTCRAIPACAGNRLGVHWALSRFRGVKSSSSSLAYALGKWNLSMASDQAASRTAIMGRPSRSTKVELARPWARRP